MNETHYNADIAHCEGYRSDTMCCYLRGGCRRYHFHLKLRQNPEMANHVSYVAPQYSDENHSCPNFLEMPTPVVACKDCDLWDYNDGKMGQCHQASAPTKALDRCMFGCTKEEIAKHIERLTRN